MVFLSPSIQQQGILTHLLNSDAFNMVRVCFYDYYEWWGIRVPHASLQTDVLDALAGFDDDHIDKDVPVPRRL